MKCSNTAMVTDLLTTSIFQNPESFRVYQQAIPGVKNDWYLLG